MYLVHQTMRKYIECFDAKYEKVSLVFNLINYYMGKFIKYAAFAALAILPVSSFVSCSEDDEDENQQIAEGAEIKSFKLYDRFGKKLCELTPEEMEMWEAQQDLCTDYWYEYQVEGSDKVYSGHFTMLK